MSHLSKVRGPAYMLQCRTLRRAFTTSPPARAAVPIEQHETSPRDSDNHIRIIEVGPRDGLQTEKAIALETKMTLIRKLAGTGLGTIEAGSFVAPKWVPQMADSDSVMKDILQNKPETSVPVSYNFLIPNTKGLGKFFSVLDESPIGASITDASPTKSGPEISIFTAATEAFSKANTNCSIDISLQRIEDVIREARARDIRVRGYVSVALGCPYEGPDVSPARVADIASALLSMGVDEVSIADTTGMGTATSTQTLLKALTAAGIKSDDLAMHLHDTYGQALVNAVVAMENGIRTFDSSVGGLGGCPYSKGATGNVATEDLVHCVHSLGMSTGVNVEKMSQIGGWITGQLGKENGSRAGKAILARLDALSAS